MKVYLVVTTEDREVLSVWRRRASAEAVAEIYEAWQTEIIEQVISDSDEEDMKKALGVLNETLAGMGLDDDEMDEEVEGYGSGFDPEEDDGFTGGRW